MFSYFTLAEANQSLPEVISKYKAILGIKNEIISIEKELSMVANTSTTMEQYLKIKQKLNSTITKFYKAIEELENLGVVIKGLEEGLIDFPSKRFDDEVWLCWKEGENEIKFWHEKDVGFNGRKPISVSDESLV